MKTLTFGIEFQAHHLITNNQDLFFIPFMQRLTAIHNN
jgi:hypothetical protein